MLGLAVDTWILGTLAIGAGLFAVSAPDQMRRGLDRFPRSVWPGRVLLTIDMFWAAYAASQLHLGGLDWIKIHFFWIAPVCIVLGSLYLDELLSVRALGGLLLLAAGPLLNAARVNPSAWRLVITVLAYIWIYIGLVFLLCPWWFRRMAGLAKTTGIMRAGGILKAVAGVGLIALALFVY